jgi:hypothetical protein
MAFQRIRRKNYKIQNRDAFSVPPMLGSRIPFALKRALKPPHIKDFRQWFGSFADSKALLTFFWTEVADWAKLLGGGPTLVAELDVWPCIY